MAKKATKKKVTKSSTKGRTRDLPARKGSAAVKGGAGSSIVSAKSTVQGFNCWVAGPRSSALGG